MKSLVEGWLATACAAALLAQVGCGPECGEGTEEYEGQCVPVCGPGAERDGQTGQCVAVCGQGTAYDETTDACLPDGDAICPEGTVFDMGALGCVLPTADVSEGQEPNDPTNDRGGTPTPFDLPAEGSTIMLGGNIDAPGEDGDGDGYPDEDIDAFEFTATAGQTLLVEATVGGLPSAVVWMGAADLFGSNPVSQSPVRYAVAMDGRNPTRTFRILETGTYYLLVTDKDNVFGSMMTGGAGMDYVVAVSVVTPPADGSVALGGSFDASLDEPQVTAVTGVTAGDVLQVDPGEAEFVRHLFVLDGSGAIVNHWQDVSFWGYLFSMGAQRFKAPTADVRLFLDYQLNLGYASPTINVTKVDVTELGTAAAGSPVSSTGHAITSSTQIDVYHFQYTAPTGAGVHGVAKISVDGRTPAWSANIRVLDSNYNWVSQGNDRVAFDWDADADYYVEVFYDGTWAAGTYSYELNVDVGSTTRTAAEGSAANDDTTTASALTYAPLPLIVTPAKIDAAGDEDYYTFTADANDTIVVTAASPTLDLEIALLDSAGGELVAADTGLDGDAETLTYTLASGETYFVWVHDWYDSYTGDYSLLITN